MPALEYKPLSSEVMGKKITKITSEAAPQKLRQAFAKGLAPGIAPSDLLTGLYQLHVVYPDLAETCKNTIEKLPEQMLVSGLQANTVPEVIDFVSGLSVPENAVKVILTNEAASPLTLAVLASTLPEKLIPVLADNHVKLLENPNIIESLYMNKNTPMSTAMVLIELAVRNGIKLELEAFSEMAKALDMDVGFKTAEDPIEKELIQAEMDQRFKEAEENTPEEIDEENEEEETKRRMILSKLTVSEKIRMAMLGNRFQRAQLIRDSNKIVAMAVIKSPTITDAEVVEYSKNKQLSEDVIRYISRRKDWLKSYKVKLNLVKNPKTPVTTSLALMNHLHPSDIRQLARSRNIPQVIRQAASRKIKQRK